MVLIPEDIPEPGVEISHEDGTTVGSVDLEVQEDGSLRLVACTLFGS